MKTDECTPDDRGMADAGMDEAAYNRRYGVGWPYAPRQLARCCALHGLYEYYNALGRISEAFAAKRVHILVLHHMYDFEESAFGNLLDRLARGHRFIGYSEAVRRIQSNEIDAPYLAFTFDDGLRSCLAASRVLHSHGARACYFVCPAFATERSRAAIQAECRDTLHIPPDSFMGEEDLNRLLADGHEIGSHSLRHKSLSSLSTQELAEQVEGSAEWIRRRFGSADHFAWPYGRWSDFSKEALKAVARAGHISCASAIRGCHLSLTQPKGTLPTLVMRDNVIPKWPARHIDLLLARSVIQRPSMLGTLESLVEFSPGDNIT